MYCDEFITYEQVIAELEKKHWQTIEPVKKIKFEAGRLKYPWLKNCVALGLASAFVEPLEATSIHATKIQLDELAKLLNNQEYDTNSYNQGIGNLYDSIKDFDLRLETYVNEAKRLMQIPLAQWKQLYQNNLELLHHNQLVFHRRDYQKIDLTKLLNNH